jgi:hypothetical protein
MYIFAGIQVLLGEYLILMLAKKEVDRELVGLMKRFLILVNL